MTNLYGNLNNQTEEIRKLYARNNLGESVKLNKLYVQNNGLSKLIYENIELPQGYTRVKCLISDGEAYINPGLTADSSFEAIFDFEWVEIPSSYVMISGNYYSRLNSGLVLIGANSTGWKSEAQSDLPLTNAPIISLNTRYIVRKRMKNNTHKVFINGITCFDGTGSYTSKKTIYLFCAYDLIQNVPINFVKIKLYSATYLTGSSFTKVRKFIPCIRDSDDEPGLYDLINNVFYSNQGSGQFTVEEY